MKIVSVDEIKEVVRLLDPSLGQEELAFKVAVVLMSAAFVTGPNKGSLAAFTSDPSSFVDDISRRMHDAGKWRDGAVRTDHWFNGDAWTPNFWVDTLVAEGYLIARQRSDGQWEYRLRRTNGDNSACVAS